MSTVPVGDSTRRLIAAVKKLEHSLRTSGLPNWMARLPVWWLSWHYCRMLDQKIARMRRIARKFELWLPAIRAADQDPGTALEFIDSDHMMRDDIDATKQTIWELRAYCIDIATMFDQLGYRSARLNRRQQLFLSVIEHTCVQACTMQETLVAHDARVLALLQERQSPPSQPQLWSQPPSQPQPQPRSQQPSQSQPQPRSQPPSQSQPQPQPQPQPPLQPQPQPQLQPQPQPQLQPQPQPQPQPQLQPQLQSASRPQPQLPPHQHLPPHQQPPHQQRSQQEPQQPGGTLAGA